MKFVFLGTDPLARHILDALETGGYLPDLIVTTKGKLNNKKILIEPTEKIWAKQRNIRTIEPNRMDDEAIEEIKRINPDVLIVASYGKILPKTLLLIPKYGVLNLHPSLLPKLRGPSPIRSAILNDEKETGVSIMLLDEQMDHGPILAQKKVNLDAWPPKGTELDEKLADAGAKLLLEVLPKWLKGEIKAVEQDHSLATYCTEFTKQDGEISLSDDPYKNFLKFKAYEGWPGVFFFEEKGGKKVRVKITDATYENDEFKILKVIPEGKKEMDWEIFEKGTRP